MRNVKYKLISLLMALVFVLGMTGVFPASAEGQDTPKRTVMFYAIGSNLESQAECFTKKFVEFSNSPYNENLDIIVLTGGSLQWHTPSEYLDGADEVDVEYDQVWKVVGKKEGEEHGAFKDGYAGIRKSEYGRPRNAHRVYGLLLYELSRGHL